jgi:HD-GYP domain-containing protein (c-di-GMP phosphodiesterase class II)
VETDKQLSPTSIGDSSETLEQRLERSELLYRVGIALSAEHNTDRLIEMILVEAQKLCHADGGTLYLVNESKELSFAILRTDSLNVALGGTTGKPIQLPPIPLLDATTGSPNKKNVASYATWLKQSVNIEDAYDAKGFDFSGMKSFDTRNRYRSKSFLTIPLATNEGIVIGVIQLINARDDNGTVKAFSREDQRVVEALCSQAAIALYNQLLLDDQRRLLESFIKLIASAIDAKSPYTGAHCERVPILTEMLARSVCDANDGPFADFALNEEEWYELHIAAWLHDCGKITTPVHVMDKATKLETIFDRIDSIRARFEILKRDAEIACLKRQLRSDADLGNAELRAEHERLDADLAFLETANVGGEFLSPEKQARIAEIALRSIVFAGQTRPLLSEDEVANLSISRGTLLPTERLIINGHMVQTVKMLESLPFPQNLRRVPEYAGGHHEKMDGTGYPKGLFAGDMSIPARIMAIADVFEALTADDRPYKKAKKLSETMRIMGFMKRDNHLDPQLFDHFVRTGVYLDYAKRFLAPALIDEVDVAALLAIEPKAFELPERESRMRRWQGFLNEYLDGA